MLTSPELITVWHQDQSQPVKASFSISEEVFNRSHITSTPEYWLPAEAGSEKYKPVQIAQVLYFVHFTQLHTFNTATNEQCSRNDLHMSVIFVRHKTNVKLKLAVGR